MSYLKDRTQVVTMRCNDKNNTSQIYKSNKSKLINTGVPKGSNLGPILFLLCINDLPDAITEKVKCLAGCLWMMLGVRRPLALVEVLWKES